MAEEIIGKIEGATLTLTGKSYNIYFTDMRMIGELLGGTVAAFVVGGLVGEAIAKKRHKKKGERMAKEERTPEQILSSHKKNFSIDYGSIVSAVVNEKACKIKLIRRGMIPGASRFAVRKEMTLKFDKRNNTNVASILMKVIPAKVAAK